MSGCDTWNPLFHDEIKNNLWKANNISKKRVKHLPIRFVVLAPFGLSMILNAIFRPHPLIPKGACAQAPVRDYGCA
jgi:hypothetical protein